MGNATQELLKRYLDELEEIIDHITKLLINKTIDRDEISSFYRPYSNICEMEKLIQKVNKQNQFHYSERCNRNIERFNSLFNENKLVFTQFVTYELTLLLSKYNSEVRSTHSWLENGTGVLGEYADGGFSDDTLTTRDLIEEVVCGIKRVNHAQFYPWIPLFQAELTRYDDYTREIIEKVTAYYAKIDAIRLPPNYLEWFSQPFWWRELELYWYNEAKNESLSRED